VKLAERIASATADYSAEIVASEAELEIGIAARVKQFRGETPVKEPVVVRGTAPRPDLPHVANAPAGFAERFVGGFPNDEAAGAEGGQGITP
jgi:hypothetical protein